MPATSLQHNPDVQSRERPLSLREMGKEYLDGPGKLNERVAKLETISKLSATIQRSLNNIVTDILKRPHLTDDAIKLFELQHPSNESRQEVSKPGEKTEDEDQQEQERQRKIQALSESLEIFLAHTPLFREFNTLLEEHPEELEHVKHMFLKVAAILIRSEVFAEKKNIEEGGQVRYNFSSYLPKAADIILEIMRRPLGLEEEGVEQVRSVDLQQRLAQLKVDLELELTDIDVRKFSLLEWVSDTARRVKSEGLRVFDTPFYRNLLNRIESIVDQRNGLAGILLFGPPGTGKTEALIEANKNQGFETRVISIHHFSDFVQLIGEKPMPLGVDKKTSYVQRLAIMRDTLDGMQGESSLKFVQGQYELFRKTHQDASLEDFLSFLVPGRMSNIPESIAQLTTVTADEIVRALKERTDSDIISVGMGLSAGVSEEVAWAYGEIIQAFKEGKRVVLDEIDKASEHSLDGISRLLNLSPGQSFSLGAEEYVLPSWSRVDATANAMNLQPFLHDRFYPNLVYVDYPPTQDVLQMSLVWLSDEQANLKISDEDQGKVIGLIRYVFKEIQDYYPDKLQYPLSLRGLRKFCQAIAQGKTVADAVNLLLFQPGALAESPDELKLLQTVVSKFGGFVSPELSMGGEQDEKDQLRKIMDSPMYNAVVDGYVPYDNKHHGLTEVHLTAEQQTLLEKRTKKGVAPVKHLVRPDGLTVDINQDDGINRITVRLHGELVTQLPKNNEHISDDAEIIGVDEDGNRIVWFSNSQVYMHEISTGVQLENFRENKGGQYMFSKDGKFLFAREKNTLRINVYDSYVDEDGNNKIKESKLSVVTPDGSSLQISRFELSGTGNVLLLEGVNRETYLVDLRLLGSVKESLRLSRPFSSQSGWKFGENDILYNADLPEAYLVG